MPYSTKTLWHSQAQPPHHAGNVAVRLSTGDAALAFWNGANWWSKGAIVHPRSWRPLAEESTSPAELCRRGGLVPLDAIVQWDHASNVVDFNQSIPA